MAGGRDTVIELAGVGKLYSLERRPLARLWRELRGDHAAGPLHRALHGVDLKVERGEVVGVIGRNGAGKSTLLQIVCGVLQPTEGTRRVDGRVAALLELGAGFNPELSGRENVRLNAPLLGLDAATIEARLPEIVAFADIGDYIDQPVRSYSSGMFVRLAFSMATSVEPDILVIDEALAVGDGAFVHKSFDRIMALKDRGATILFCSHALFQVESLCQRAIWLRDGMVAYDGAAAQAVVEYRAWLEQQDAVEAVPDAPQRFGSTRAELQRFEFDTGTDRAPLRSGHDDLVLSIDFRSDPGQPCPTLGVVIHGADRRPLASALNWSDGLAIERDGGGAARLRLRFDRLALLKGRYTLSAYLMCERALNVLSAAEHALGFEVVQDHLEQGLVSLPHQWANQPPAPHAASAR